ncbi:pca operon transcription factor PcaQ [Alterinioella nitratireducens]|uniref:pca operon transcription factor PcaQ n=1 Tax=Alterinioella nitratireducens TaxID=2735915 RepID=UPI00405A4266
MIDRRIKIRHIQAFVEITRQGRMNRAAEALYLTQPAMSRTLKELEEIVGQPLLIRSRAGVTLTPQGKVFLHFARMSLAALRQGFDGVAQVERRGRSLLSVGLLPSVAAWLMPEVVREAELALPELALRILDGPHAYLIERLRSGDLDLVIGRMGPPDTMQGLSFMQLYNEHVVFVTRPGHPILEAPSLDALTDWPVVYPPDGSAIAPLVERFLIANGVGEIPRKLETVSGAFGRVYTHRSDAIWIISSGVVANEVAEGKLVELPFDTSLTTGPVGLMLRPDAEPALGVEPFRKVLEEVVARLVPAR